MRVCCLPPPHTPATSRERMTTAPPPAVQQAAACHLFSHEKEAGMNAPIEPDLSGERNVLPLGCWMDPCAEGGALQNLILARLPGSRGGGDSPPHPGPSVKLKAPSA